ncbi:protein NKG7-like isoform X1 [Pelodiscus sinensis]|uniref:protein NKG7-like isoform X1 n=1 Tax=Pelodiscus sinensis TaxID=13735 RepID=UPI003F6B2663
MFPYRAVNICLNLFSFLLFLLTGACPYWLLLSSEVGTLHLGIWSLCKGNFCKSLPARSSMLDASRGFLLLGIIFAFISALCCFNSFLRQASKFFPETNVSAMTCFTAGALGLLGSVTFLVFEIHVPPHPEIKHTYDWAFYLSWAVGPAFALAGISSLITQKHLPILGTKLGSQVAPEGGMGTSLA